jgi:hypothetical protein
MKKKIAIKPKSMKFHLNVFLISSLGRKIKQTFFGTQSLIHNPAEKFDTGEKGWVSCGVQCNRKSQLDASTSCEVNLAMLHVAVEVGQPLTDYRRRKFY